MLLLLSWYEFTDEKMQDSDAFYECVTDQPTDRPTDTAYYRDARTHLKMQCKTTTHEQKSKPTLHKWFTSINKREEIVKRHC